MPPALRAAGFLLGLGLAGLLAAGTAAAQVPTTEDCLACHQDPGLERSAPRPGRPASVSVDPGALEGSTHGAFDCVACHTTATVPHDERLPRVDCGSCHGDVRTALAGGVHRAGQARGRTPGPSCTGCHGTHAVKPADSLTIDTCATCHGSEVAVYRQSIHGRSRAQGSEAATCRSCHGPAHGVLPAKDPQAPTYHLNLPRTCATCHADPELVKRYRIPVGDVYKLYLDSIHGRALSRSGLLVAANCSDCHGTHDIRARGEPASRVFRTNVPNTCGRCHAGVLREYQGGIHGEQAAAGNPIAPVCSDCHSAHEIRRVETEAWKLDIVRECGTCHVESLKTYRDTFHGKVTALGFTRVARCSDCHGA
ncbi:MAG: cytochrome c3 family protein, partial [Candidatus Rokubacteria bacterium]|nr:cytochrome c3 family protein [Candidatus Rokubacteria bacterium]